MGKNNMSYFAIMASHRKNKHTDKALNDYINKLEEQGCFIEKINLIDYNIKLCTACGYCSKNYGKCIIEDDMNFFYEKFKQYNNFIFASPVYFNSISSIGKIFIDRCQMVFECNFSHNKPFVQRENKGKGILISVGGAYYYENQFLGSELVLKPFFKDIGVEFVEHVKISGTDKNHLSSK